ncbi:hypothetical protein V6N13_033753 [Hibiscus sabdariffa]
MVDVHMSNNRAALRLFLDSFGGTEPSSVPANSVSPGNSQESLPGSFNCFDLLMPDVDKLPARLREDLESTFSDDMDNVFDISYMRHSLGQQKRDTEIDLKREVSSESSVKLSENSAIAVGISCDSGGKVASPRRSCTTHLMAGL